MLIVKIDSNDGFHPSEFQYGRVRCWKDGYIEVPKNLEDVLMDTKGYCDLVVDGEALINVIPQPDREPKISEEDFEVTAIEQLRADIDYLALMSGVNL